MLSTVPSALYYINDPYIDVSIPLYSLTPGTCPYELTYSAALADNSPLPNAITLQNQSGSHFLRLSETNPLATGVYQVRISVVDPKTSLSHTNLLIDVTVLCTKSITLVSSTIPASTIYTINTSQLLTTSFNLPLYHPFPTNCAIGALTFQMMAEPAGPLATFITSTPTIQINIATIDTAQAGSYDFRLQVTDTLTSL
jgi:hypothetical protein